MSRVWVKGVGMTRFDKYESPDETELAARAIALTLDDAGVGSAADARIDLVVVGNVFGGPGVAQRALATTPLAGKPIINVENACASSSTAILLGEAWIRAGMASSVLVLGVEVLTGRFGGMLPLDESDAYQAQGLTLPSLYALKAQQYLQKYGGDASQFAAVSVKNREHARMNPNARFSPGDIISIEDVMGSTAVSEPLTLLQCCANADGAAAALLVNEELASRSHDEAGGRPIELLGSAMRSGLARQDIGFEEGTMAAVAAEAYSSSGIGPTDIDVAEVHDAFAPGELLAYEYLGFAPAGKGGAELQDGRFRVGSNVAPVVNPSGGLLGRGHPPGATGLAQVHEVVTQLRGDAGRRQVAGARTGLCVSMGGNVPQLETNACVVTIFR